MGFFGRFVYSDGAWRDDPAADAFLVVDIHDSDIAIVEFRSATTAGRFYLGFQPRDYWEIPMQATPWTLALRRRALAPGQTRFSA